MSAFMKTAPFIPHTFTSAGASSSVCSGSLVTGLSQLVVLASSCSAVGGAAGADGVADGVAEDAAGDAALAPAGCPLISSVGDATAAASPTVASSSFHLTTGLSSRLGPAD